MNSDRFYVAALVKPRFLLYNINEINFYFNILWKFEFNFNIKFHISLFNVNIECILFPIKYLINS